MPVRCPAEKHGVPARLLPGASVAALAVPLSLVDKRNLLEARAIITTYNQYVLAPLSRALVGWHHQSLLGPGSRHLLWNHYAQTPSMSEIP